MPDQKTITLKEMPPATFVDTLEALDAHRPRLEAHVHLALRVSGDDTDLATFYRNLYGLTAEYGVEITTTIKGVFPKDGISREQMRLFPPPPTTAEGQARVVDDEEWSEPQRHEPEDPTPLPIAEKYDKDGPDDAA